MKTKSSSATVLLLFALLSPTFGQVGFTPEPVKPQSAPPARQQQRGAPVTPEQSTPAAPSQPQDESDVVRITSNLVQVDVSVTDKKGRPVTDLRPEDFTVYQDGKEQQITNFSYISTETLAPSVITKEAAPADALKASKLKVLPALTPPPRRGDIRRAIALVISNRNAPFFSVANSQAAIRKFVAERIQPGDLVGIYGTRGGSGALQQFTTDRARLLKTVDAIRWVPPEFGEYNPKGEEPARDDSTYKPIRAGSGEGSRGQQTFEDERSRQTRERLEDRNSDLAAFGLLGTLRYVIHGMRMAPGRKSIILFGAGLPIVSRYGLRERSSDEIKRVVEDANRAGVVIYTVDARGVYNPYEMDAASSQGSPWPDAVPTRYPVSLDSGAGGYSYLSEQTGGLSLQSNNDLDKLLDRALLDQSSYYLIGYRPSEETFKAGRAFNLKVKVNRPGLEVRTRAGFSPATNDEMRRRPRGSDSELYETLAAPVNAGDLFVRMTTSIAGRTPQGATAVRMRLYIEGRGFSFTDVGAGWKKTVLDVAAVTLSKDGKIVDEFTRTHTLRTGGDILQNIVQNGLTYTADVPVKKPGIYQLRIVVRDQASGRMGSASQFLEAPDLTQARLTVSGLSLRGLATDGAQAQTESALPTAETALAAVAGPSDPTVRRFQPGTTLSYSYQIFNATSGASGTTRPHLTAQARLFHNGEVALTGDPAPVELDPTRPLVMGNLRLPSDVKPGNYALQVIVTDEAAKDKNRRQVAQWIDFEVVR